MKNLAGLNDEIIALENEERTLTQQLSATKIKVELLSAEIQIIDTLLKAAKIALQDQNPNFIHYITTAVTEKQENLRQRFKESSDLIKLIPDYEEKIAEQTQLYITKLSILSANVIPTYLTELSEIHQKKDQEFNELFQKENNLIKDLQQQQHKLETQRVLLTLTNACITGDVKKVQEQLPKIKSIFLIKKSTVKIKLLHLACQHKQLEVVKVLLANGVNPFIQDENRKSAFTLSANDTAMHEVLLQGVVEFLSKKHIEKLSQEIPKNNVAASAATAIPSFQENFRAQTRLVLALDNIVFNETFFNLSEEFWTNKNIFKAGIQLAVEKYVAIQMAFNANVMDSEKLPAINYKAILQCVPSSTFFENIKVNCQLKAEETFTKITVKEHVEGWILEEQLEIKRFSDLSPVGFEFDPTPKESPLISICQFLIKKNTSDKNDRLQLLSHTVFIPNSLESTTFKRFMQLYEIVDAPIFFKASLKAAALKEIEYLIQAAAKKTEFLLDNSTEIELIKKLYTSLSEAYRGEVIDGLSAIPNNEIIKNLIETLINLPDPNNGKRQAERFELRQLYEKIFRLRSDVDTPEVELKLVDENNKILTFSVTPTVAKQLTAALIDASGKLQKYPPKTFFGKQKGPRHIVIPVKLATDSEEVQLYFKIMPDQTVLSRFVFSLEGRLFGFGGKAPTTMGKLIFHNLKDEQSCPVEISLAMPGKNFQKIFEEASKNKQNINFDDESYARAIFSSILFLSGDHSGRNFNVIENANKELVIKTFDNTYFVNPHTAKKINIKEILFFFAIYRLPNKLLSTTVSSFDMDAVLYHCLKDAMPYEEACENLFSLAERELFWNENPDFSFAANAMLPEITLLKKRLLEFVDLLRNENIQLIDVVQHFYPEIAKVIKNLLQQKYLSPQQCLEKMCGEDVSMPSKQAYKLILDKIPTETEVNSRRLYSITAALNQLLFSRSNYDIQCVEVLGENERKRLYTVKLDFSTLKDSIGEPDKRRHRHYLKVLHKENYAFKSLTLTNNVSLTDNRLLLLLEKSSETLEYLDVSGCTRITQASIEPLLTKCSIIKHLSINYTAVEQLKVERPLVLESLHAQNCTRLKVLLINAKYLEKLVLSDCGELGALEIQSKKLQELYLSRCRNLDAHQLERISVISVSNFDENIYHLRELHLKDCPKIPYAQFLLKYPFFISISLKKFEPEELIAIDQLLQEMLAIFKVDSNNLSNRIKTILCEKLQKFIDYRNKVIQHITTVNPKDEKSSALKKKILEGFIESPKIKSQNPISLEHNKEIDIFKLIETTLTAIENEDSKLFENSLSTLFVQIPTHPLVAYCFWKPFSLQKKFSLQYVSLNTLLNLSFANFNKMIQYLCDWIFASPFTITKLKEFKFASKVIVGFKNYIEKNLIDENESLLKKMLHVVNTEHYDDSTIYYAKNIFTFKRSLSFLESVENYPFKINRKYSNTGVIDYVKDNIADLNQTINQEKFKMLLADIAAKLAQLSFILQILTGFYQNKIDYAYEDYLSPETKKVFERLKKISYLFREQIDDEQVFEIAYDTLGELGKYNPIIASNLIKKFSSARSQAAVHAFGMTHCYTDPIAIDKLLELPSNSSTISALYELGKIAAFKTTMTRILQALLTENDTNNESLNKLLTSEEEKRNAELNKLWDKVDSQMSHVKNLENMIKDAESADLPPVAKLEQLIPDLIPDLPSIWNSPSTFFSTSSEDISNEKVSEPSSTSLESNEEEDGVELKKPGKEERGDDSDDEISLTHRGTQQNT